MPRVLLVEEDEGLRQRLQIALDAERFETTGVGTVPAALRELAARPFQIVVVGMRAAAASDVVPALHRARPGVRVVALVPAGATTIGLDAMAHGAADFLAGAVDARDLVLALIKAETRARAFHASAATPPPELRAPLPGTGSGPIAAPEIVGRSAAMLDLLATVRRVAAVKATILVRGESGTGKELVARALHQLSPRAAGPFVTVSCGAILPGLLDSELFGHVRGAFTDAIRDRQGLVEQASGGTLFLDEVGELPPELQVKLLRVLQEEEIRRVGDAMDVKVDVRVVAATARDLESEVRAGRFREDLLYRLDVIDLELPALRDRLEDVPLLAEHFLARARRRFGLQLTGITPEALQVLVEHRWPGNVRELENTIERAAVLTDRDVIDVDSLPERLRGLAGTLTPGPVPLAISEAEDLSLKRASRRAEEDLIRRVLARTGGNRTRAAELLHISHRALLYKIKDYGIV